MATTTTTIRPSAATHGQTTKLNAIDQIAPRDYVASYLFFRLLENTDKAAVFRLLERGLFTTVQQIPQLMSCIGISENNRDDLELRFDQDCGATISMKDFTNAELKSQWSPGSFDDLEREYFPLKRLPREHVLPKTEFPGQKCLSSLAMQANFIEGGLILTGCLHHTVCDGTGNLVFYSILAQHISAATAGRLPDPISESSISFLDRTSVVTPEVDVKLEDFPDWKLVGADAAFLNPCDYDPETSPAVQYATYFISEANLQKLKGRLSAGSGNNPTSTEAACAFLWKHTVKARDVDTEKYPETKLSITVNTRTRMRSPVCSSVYWGNLSEPNAVARMPTRLFCEGAGHDGTSSSSRKTGIQQGSNTADEGPFSIYSKTKSSPQTSDPGNASLPTAALRVKQAIAAVDNSAVRRLVGILNQMSKSTSLTWNVDRWPGPDMLIVCLNGAKFNHVDFGPALGCSEATRLTVGAPDGKPDGRCFIWPPRKRDGRGLEVMMQYDANTLQRLKECAEFREFFEWRN